MPTLRLVYNVTAVNVSVARLSTAIAAVPTNSAVESIYGLGAPTADGMSTAGNTATRTIDYTVADDSGKDACENLLTESISQATSARCLADPVVYIP